MTVAEAVEEQTLGDGLDDYTRVRFHLARGAGLTRIEAHRFATGTETIRTLRWLKDHRCDPAVIARIVT